MTKELFVCRLPGRLEVLVPKKRGQGYRLTPVGHHMCPLADLAQTLCYDFMGLDGSIAIYGDGMQALDACEQSEAMAEALPKISALLGIPYRELGAAEFYALHPNSETRARAQADVA